MTNEELRQLDAEADAYQAEADARRNRDMAMAALQNEIIILRTRLGKALGRIVTLRAAMHKVAFDPIGHPESSCREVLDDLTMLARVTLKATEDDQ